MKRAGALSDSLATSPIRQVNAADLTALEEVVDTSGLFSPSLLKGLLKDYLTNADTGEFWLTKDVTGVPGVLAWCVPERYTDNAYMLNLLAVHSRCRRLGLAAEMLAHVEEGLALRGGRLLVLEVSAHPEFALARRFYPKHGFRHVATVPDFYADGEDKLLFWKRL